MNTDKPVIIGEHPSGAAATVDVAKLIGSHLCVVANSGGGKSGLLRRLLEVTHGKVQHIVLDAEDEFYTLRERFPYVIAGGEGGDVPAGVENAGSLALAALEHSLSLVVQLNDMPDRAAFVGKFLESLVDAPRQLWRPVLVIIDEAHRFAPEGATVESSEGVRALLERGRKRGFTAVLASQRMAKIAKSITAEVNNWCLGRVGQPLDRDRAADALGFKSSSTDARALQSLPPRTFWGFGPALSQVPVQFRVADVATTIVRAGQIDVPTPPAPEALGKILRELARATAATAAAAPEKADAAPGLTSAVFKELGWLRTEWDKLKRELPLVLEKVRRADEARVSAMAHLEVVLDAVCPVDRLPEEEEPASASTIPATAPEPEPETPTAPRGQRPPKMAAAILAVLAAHRPDVRTKSAVALQAGYSPKSGSFRNALSQLRVAGYIRAGEPLRITPAGVAAAAEVPPMPRGQALLDFWCGEVGGMPAKILRTLAERPGAWAKERLAKETGYAVTSGSFRNALSRLRTLGLITGERGDFRVHLDLIEKGGRR